jgi:hypothetical protein
MSNQEKVQYALEYVTILKNTIVLKFFSLGGGKKKTVPL